MRILLLDNYDSFTYNLLHLLEKVGGDRIQVDVHRNDAIVLEEVGRYDKIVLSPGPGLPADAGIMPDLLREYAGRKPILGVCLGLQAIAEHFGGHLINLEQVVHGQARQIEVLQPRSIFKECPPQFSVGRYHSWVVDRNSLPEALEVTAVDEQGQVMAIQHRTWPVQGVQFHPESILSEYGKQLMQHWIEEA